MKFLFKVTEDKVFTLLRGVDFESDGVVITLIKENKKIAVSDLGYILFSGKYGYVIFTDNSKKCNKFQKQIRQLLKDV